jgi:membrane-bound metal-dependent hydrolase YbcI (DUF457 family)
MPLPIAHGLVGASVVALWRPKGLLGRDWRKMLIGAALAISPDLDFFLPWGLHLRGWHRGFTHSISLALAATGLMIAVLGISHLRDALAYGTALLSHGLLDFLTTQKGGGVELLWPFSNERLKLGWIGFSEFPFGFHVVEVIKASLIEILVFAPVLVALLLLREYVFTSFRPTRNAI